MKSAARSFVLLGLALNTGCATAQSVQAFDPPDPSPGSVTPSEGAVGPQLTPIWFARPASRDLGDARTIHGYSVARNETAASGISEIRPGVLGAGIGAVVGGVLGWASVAIHCDNGVSCNSPRAIVTGAAIGAVLGLFVEWFVRSDRPSLLP
jgi:hypothetical protein